MVAAGPAPAPWSPPAVQCKEHGPALVAPEQGCVGVEAILLDALAELAVCGVDRLRGAQAGHQAVVSGTCPPSQLPGPAHSAVDTPTRCTCALTDPKRRPLRFMAK